MADNIHTTTAADEQREPDIISKELGNGNLIENGTAANTPNEQGGISEDLNNTECIAADSHREANNKEPSKEQGVDETAQENKLEGATEKQAEQDNQCDAGVESEEVQTGAEQRESGASAAKDPLPVDCAVTKEVNEETEEENTGAKESTSPAELNVVNEELDNETEGKGANKEGGSENLGARDEEDLVKKEGEEITEQGKKGSEQVPETKSCSETDAEQGEESSSQQKHLRCEDKKRSVTVDDHEDLVELCAKSGKPTLGDEENTAQCRSGTFGPGNEARPEAAHIDVQSRTVWYNDKEETSEPVSYSTTIVGGVVHRVPIESSPKAQPKSPKNSGQQSQGIFKNLSSLFGKRRKSKGESAQSTEGKVSSADAVAEPGKEATSDAPEGERKLEENGGTVNQTSEQLSDEVRTEEAANADVSSLPTEDKDSGKDQLNKAVSAPTNVEKPTESTEAQHVESTQEENVADGDRVAEPTEVQNMESTQEENMADGDRVAEPTEVQHVESTQDKSVADGHIITEAENDVQNVESTQELSPESVTNDEKSAESEDAATRADNPKEKDEQREENTEEEAGQTMTSETTSAQEDEGKAEVAGDEQPVESAHPDVKSEPEVQQTSHNGASIPELQTPVKKDVNSADTAAVSSDESREGESSPGEGSQFKEPVVKRQTTAGSYSPKTQHMQMRVSYAERTPQGDLEVEILSSPERAVHKPKAGSKRRSSVDLCVSCRELGEADHEGWLYKKGGNMLFASWKRKWVVLKEERVYYYKTSFDMQAGGVILLNGCVVAAAPDVKRKFCFTCEQPEVKAGKVFFAADNKEDMDKWLGVLSLASRGESIVKASSTLKVDQGNGMRKKSNSISKTKRSESVLGLGGRFDDFYNDKEDHNNTRKRTSSTGAVNTDESSIDKEPKSLEQNDKPVESGDKQQVPDGEDGTGVTTEEGRVSESVDTESIDIKTEPSPVQGKDSSDGVQDAPIEVQQQADSESAPTEDRESVEALKELSAAVVSTEGSTPSGDEITPHAEPRPDPLVNIASTSPHEEAPQQGGAVPESTTALHVSVHGGREDPSEVDTAQQSSADVPLLDERTVQLAEEPAPADEAAPQHREDASALDCAPPQASEEESRVEADNLQASDKTASGSGGGVAPQQSEEAIAKPDESITAQTNEATCVVANAPSVDATAASCEEAMSVTAATDDKKQPELSEDPRAGALFTCLGQSVTPTNQTTLRRDGSNKSTASTTWYCVLDSENDAWAVADEAPEAGANPQDKQTASVRISDSNEDQLMELCKTVNASRLSIIGYPLLDSHDRLRAMSSANKQQEVSQNILKLRAMERSLKDMEKDISSCDELLTAEVNRHSIVEWVQQHPILSANMEDVLEGDEAAAQDKRDDERGDAAELETHL